ncbi:hypothetical protein [Curtobacterium sp. VKM Ac-2922]|uniref:hypothetical protein n=1 Tax=Curtobacterium sp. VKM Ac-2922 TaxID=2929475 RepID=UPI001FB51183|nr:hypothetical protein [Curtobacterium sp. VKM Ac-2922]MCJ1715167.1 hypothetical protein [Curtobacterium sp. VKM Ac-2922]
MNENSSVDPSSVPLWGAVPRKRAVHPVDLLVSGVIEILGILMLIPLALLREHWRGMVGEVNQSVPVWLIAGQIFLVIASGIAAALMLRSHLLAFWVPAAAAMIGFIGIVATVFLVAASLPCPSLC